MSIMASHELGLGSYRDKDTSRSNRDIGTSNSKIEPYSRDYFHVIDITRIHRLLRPMKAKVAAIQLAIKSSPPLSHLCKETSIEQDNDDDNPHGRPQTRTWEKSVAPRQRTLRRTPTNRSSSSTKAISAAGSTETLVKKYGPSLKGLFQEVIEKVWWRPFCEDHHLPPNATPATAQGQGIAPGRNTLGRACAFTVGRIAASLQEDNLDIMEKHYNIMPSYMRRFAVLQHVTELCVLYIPVPLLIQPLVAVCVQYKADYQGLSLLQHMFECQDADFRLNYVWAYSAAQQLECSDTWIQYLSKNLRTDHLYRKSFRDFLLVIRPEHRATLVRAAFDTLMGQAEPLAGKRIWRPKLLSWASQLIEDSLNVHQMASESEEESSTSVCDDVIDHIAWTIYACAKAQWGASVAVWHSLKDLGLGLALHSLYIAVTGSTALEEYEKVERWISILRIHDDRNTSRTDFDILFKAFGLLTNLNALALMLDAVELYDLSMRLLQAMIYDYEELSWKTKDQLGYVCDVTLSSLSRHLEEVRQRKVETLAHDDWYYDDVLEDWVERSPKTDRICRTSWQSSDEEEEHARFSPATKTRRSVDYDREDAHSDVSFDSLADNARTPPRNKNRTSTRISPFVLRSPIHFAMTPLTRPNLTDHQTAPCYAELEDLNHYQNITQDEEDDEAQEADDEDQEEEQSVDEFEVSATLIPDIMGDGDPDPDCYVARGTNSSSDSSVDSFRSRGSHISVSENHESNMGLHSNGDLAEATQRSMDGIGSDSDSYVDPSEQRKLNPIYRPRKHSPSPQYSSPSTVRSESKSPSPAPHIEQAHVRNHGIFLDSSLDTTPPQRRLSIVQFSRSPSLSPDKSPLRSRTNSNRYRLSLTDSDSDFDAPLSPDQRSPKYVIIKGRNLTVPYVEIPSRRHGRKLWPDSSPSPSSSPSPDRNVLSDHLTEPELDHEYETLAAPQSLRTARSQQPSVIEILDTDRSESSRESSSDEYKPCSRQTNAIKHTTRSSSPMHRTLTASSLARPRTSYTILNLNRTTSSVSNKPSVHNRTSKLTRSSLSVKSQSTPRAANNPATTPGRKKRTISMILNSEFSDSGDSEYSGSENKTKKKSVKPSSSSSSSSSSNAKQIFRGKSRKRRNTSYGDEQTDEDQSNVDEDDSDEEFVHYRKKLSRSSRVY